MSEKETPWEYDFWNNIKKWGVDDLSFKQLERAYKIAYKRQHDVEFRPGGISPKDQERVDEYRKSVPNDSSLASDMARKNDSEVLARILEVKKISEEFHEKEAKIKRESEYQIFLDQKEERDRIFYAKQDKILEDQTRTESNTRWMKNQADKWMLMTVVDEPEFVCTCGVSPDPAKCGNHKHHYFNAQDHMECWMCLRCRMRLGSKIKSSLDYKCLSFVKSEIMKGIQANSLIVLRPVDNPLLLN